MNNISINQIFPGVKIVEDHNSSSDENLYHFENLNNNSSDFLFLYGETNFSLKSTILYETTILNRYNKEDKIRPFNNNYLNEIQKDLFKTDRNLLVKWIILTGISESLSYDAIFLSIRIFDYILSTFPIYRSTLKINASACILLASKMEDSPKHDLCNRLIQSISESSESIIVDTELILFKHLNYNVSFITSFLYLRLYLQQLNSENIKIYNNKFNELSKIISLCSISYEKCLIYSNDLICKNCLIISSNILNINLPNKYLKDLNLEIQKIICEAIKFVLEESNSFINLYFDSFLNLLINFVIKF